MLQLLAALMTQTEKPGWLLKSFCCVVARANIPLHAQARPPASRRYSSPSFMNVYAVGV